MKPLRDFTRLARFWAACVSLNPPQRAAPTLPFDLAEGGIVLWGVDARRTKPEEADVICGVPGLDNADIALSCLTTLTAQGASPPVPIAVHRKIEVDGKWIVATYVAASDEGPHMGKLGCDRYFRRSSDSFLRMEHHEIADMFGRRPKPKLKIYFRFQQAGGLNCKVLVGIKNEGRGLAKGPYLALRLPWPMAVSRYGVDGNGTFPLRDISASDKSYSAVFGGNLNDVIHAGTELAVAIVSLAHREPEQIPREKLRDLVITGIVSAEGMMTAQYQQTFHLVE